MTSKICMPSSAWRSALSAKPVSKAAPSTRWIAAVAAKDRARSRGSDRVRLLRMPIEETRTMRRRLLCL